MDPSPLTAAPRRSDWRAPIEPIIRHAGWLAFFLILAPIIGPRGYGLFAMALSGIAIAEAMLTEGVASALDGVGPLDDRHLSTALVSAVGGGAIVSLLLFIAAGQVDRMIDEPPLADIFQSLSLLPVLGGLSAVPIALLRRRTKRGPFIAAAAAGLGAGGGVGLALAWAGAGPWSLVAQIVAQRFVECAVLWGMSARRIGLAWSPAHFAALVGALSLRGIAPAWPAVARHGRCLLIGLVLGPVATGLYMLAGHLADAADDILLAGPPPVRRALLPSWADSIGGLMHRVALPAVLGSTLLAIALPPLVDIRWWGAVAPAQLLFLGLIPAAGIRCRQSAVGRRNEARWQAVQTLSGLAVVAIAAASGLTAVAAASVAYTVVVALASLVPIARELGSYSRRAAALAASPLAAAAAAGLVLACLAEPVGLALAPLPALGLLGALGRLLYLLLRGEPRDAPQLGTVHRRIPQPTPA